MIYNERDELGQKLLSFNGTTLGQTIDYQYNIRKWLTQINDPDACNPNLFGMRLGYTTANASLNATAKYNGNIAWIEWRAGAYCVPGGVARYKSGYGFTYDGLDRMTASKYGEYLSPSWTNFDRYNENLTYDASGNILTLNRRGYISAGTYNVIDNLTYTLDATNTNRVSSIADASGSTLGFPAASGAYTYDSNGNQISDGAKGFTAITYNHLNLPTKFTQGANTIEIQYDASGRKLKKILSGGTTKSYIGSFEYVGTTVEAVYHSEGRARNNSGTYVYEYVIKDHLGNSRVMFTNTSGAIAQIQENHYYPFGLEQAGWITNPTPPYAYKYNGKELNVDFGLNMIDYGARWYDAGVGRFTTIDPLASKMQSWSTYTYGFNNPIRFIEPTGMAPDDFVRDNATGQIRWDNNANSQASTKQGETYLGNTLNVTFNSYIDAKSWDGPNKNAPGDKLTSNIQITGNENASGELTSISASKSITVGTTPIGSARDYYPGEGGKNNTLTATTKISGASVNFEQHASVSKVEQFGLNALGFKIVDVAQKLNVDINKNSGAVTLNSATGIFPSASLSVNGKQIMQYNQPSFINTHSAPTVGTSSPSSGSLPIRDFSYYPTKFYNRN